MIALAAVFTIIALAGLMTTGWFAAAIHNFGPDGNRVWLGAGAGAVGAFFSIATAIRDRTILTDLQLRDNAADAVLRVIGMIAGAFVILILLSEAASLSVGSLNLRRDSITASGSAGEDSRVQLVMLLGFAAGFSERMLNDLLAKVTPLELAVQTRVAATNPVTPPPPPAPSPGPATADTPRGPADTTGDPSAGDDTDEADADVDCCVVDVELAADEVTDDAELPEATGGVER